MSLLAETRSKKKFGINPRGGSWSKDENKFGQKLMEKMGWSAGKGLGANEDGDVNHISVRVKTDTVGLGATKDYGDSWIAHQDDFNALLSSLNSQSTDNLAPGDEKEEQDKKVSLEEKSKSSRSRVHYQRFTRGKDLSRSSATDLDCIFGRRQKSNPSTPLTQSMTNSPQGSDTETENSNDPTKEVEETKEGVQLVTNQLSVGEYFKQKMAAMKSKLKTSGSQSSFAFGEKARAVSNQEASSTNTNESVSAFDLNSCDARPSFHIGECDDEVTEKRKKSKKKKKDPKNILEKNQSESSDPENNSIRIKKKKRDKKRQREAENNKEALGAEDTNINSMEKKTFPQIASGDLIKVSGNNENETSGNIKIKKKKNKKQKVEAKNEEQSSNIVKETSSENSREKRKQEDTIDINPASVDNPPPKKKKKCKKEKDVEGTLGTSAHNGENRIPELETLPVESQTKRKKSKKQKKNKQSS